MFLSLGGSVAMSCEQLSEPLVVSAVIEDERGKTKVQECILCEDSRAERKG